MGFRVAERQQFIKEVNDAFSAQEIGGTAERLRALSQGADFLDIVHVLGFLRWVPPGGFARYRQRLPIPPLVMRILTDTFRTAIQHAPNPMPIHLSIVEGPAEGVSVTVQKDRFEVVLTRVGFDSP